MARPLKILLVAAEVVPFAKVGGLADVAGSLPKALAALGHDVRVAMPRYGRIDPARFELERVLDQLAVPMDDRTETVSIWQGSIGRQVPVYFVDAPAYFGRDGIYGYEDDAERFILFCRSALELVKQLDWRPDIIHANDWHTAIIPNWLKTIYQHDAFFADTATVYTIHNLQYQGIFGWRVLEVAGIGEYRYLHHPRIPQLSEVVNLMARGIACADVVDTVSPTYAREILTPEYGEGLEPLLNDRKDRLFGILNGIDYDDLNPATDRYIFANYEVDSLERRTENKVGLQREARLTPNVEIPLIGIISRLADQKGFDLLGEVIDHLLALDVQMVLLGTGEQHYHELFNRVARDYPEKFAVFLTFNAPLAQKIYAGSDLFLMPSRFEPCGLGQMIAMRYGSVPIVRRTGGLADTVQDFNPRSGEGTGFVFGAYDRWMLFAAVVRALENFKYPASWRKLQAAGMTTDFSWRASASQYVELYEQARAFLH